MKQILIVNKPQGLHGKFMERLKEAEEKIKPNSKKIYVPFPVIFEKVCRAFSITKQEAWTVLFTLQDFGCIEVIRGHGIKLKY